MSAMRKSENSKISSLFVKFKGESRNKEPHFGHTFLLGGGSGGGESTHF